MSKHRGSRAATSKLVAHTNVQATHKCTSHTKRRKGGTRNASRAKDKMYAGMYAAQYMPVQAARGQQGVTRMTSKLKSDTRTRSHGGAKGQRPSKR